MVPIFQTPAEKPPDAVTEAEATLFERDGPYYVGQRYFAKQADASFVRRLEAERIVRARERQEALVCAFCFEKISGQVAVVIAMRAVHPACAKAFDEWYVSHPGENDPRWRDVTDDTPVDFDGELCRWGDLHCLADRKTVDMRPDGTLVGGYPI